MPEFRAPQRAAVSFGWSRHGSREEGVVDGWVQVEGPWVHLLPDDGDHWVTWPQHVVLAIDWRVS